MTTDVPASLELTPLSGKARSIAEWTTNFHLAIVVVDPFTLESSWILDTATRLLRHYAQADVRIALLVTGTIDEAKQFLGPLATEFLVFADPERAAVAGFALESLPAFVHINQHHQVEVEAQGWDPESWKAVAANLSDRMGWGAPIIPAAGDPSPFVGSPALG